MFSTHFKSRKVAFLFQDGLPASADLLGGKGAGLVELVGLGIPVPPGFVIPTSVARAYAQHQQVPSRLAHQLNWSIEALERETGKVFDCRQNALLVSVRSGAKFSMPGMMDTVLNLGINPEVAAGLARQYDARFAYDCYRRFLQMFGAVVLGVERTLFEEILSQVKQHRGIDDDRALDGGALKEVCNRFRLLIEERTGKPVVDDPRRQLEMAIIAVLRSWHNPRAVQYRRLNRIANGLGTAVNVVAMVYGNRDERSGTGVVFSRNVATGDRGIWGEFMCNAQGEDVVSGGRTPQPVAALRSVVPEVYDRLVAIVDDLDRRRGQAVDIEFTIESGNLYILQVRRAKLSPEAAATIAVHEVWNKKVTKEVAVSRLSKEQIKALRIRTFEPKDLARAIAEGPLGKGFPPLLVAPAARSSSHLKPL